MSFQAYIDNIKKKRRNSPEDLKRLAEKRGLIKEGEIGSGVKATDITKLVKTRI